MEIELHVRPHRCGQAGHFTYKHFINGEEEANVYLFSQPGYTDEEYRHVMEHETIELVCARTAFLDGAHTWNAKGFNRAYYQFIENQGKFY